MITAILLGIAASVMPSPHNFYTLWLGLNKKYSEVLMACAAGLFVDVCLILVSGLMTSFIQKSNFVLLIYLVGGSFCLLMAYRLFCTNELKTDNISERKSFFSGLCAQLVNPNPYIFWTSIAWPLILKQSTLAEMFLFPIVFLALVYGGKYIVARMAGEFGQSLIEKSWGYVKLIVATGLCFVSLSFYRQALILVQNSFS